MKSSQVPANTEVKKKHPGGRPSVDDKKIVWTSEKRNAHELCSAKYNPRILTSEQEKMLTSSLEKFSLADPIIINKNNTVIGGHQRIKILKSKGIKEFDVRVPHRVLSDSEEKELNLRLNRNLGEWDFKLLGEFEEDMLKDVGFDSKELDKIFTGDVIEDADEAPAPRQKTDIKAGDLYQLGDHRLLCGDSTKREDVEKLMQGEEADMVFTDPPYGVAIGAKNRFLNSFQKAGRNLEDIKDDALSPEELYKVLLSAFSNLKSVLADCCSVFTCAPQGGGLGMMMMMMMMRDAGLEVRHVLIWCKNRPTFSMGRLDYDYQHEPILLSWNKSHKFYGGGKHRTSVWQIDNPMKSKEHPTMKPVALVVNAILNNSTRENIVADIFGGSGTTLIACEETSRKCRMMEIDPIYCQVIIDRWEKHTGKKAKKL